MQANGWLPTDFRLEAITPLTDQQTPDTTAKIIGKAVYFYRYVNGKPVAGVSRVIVHVGTNGEVIGVKRFFKDIVPVGNMALKSIKEAFDELRRGDAILTTDNPNLKEAAVTNVDLTYWEDAGSTTDQPYLQPVYVFRAKGTAGASDEFSAVVPALNGVTLGHRIGPVAPSRGPKLGQ